MDIKLGKGNKNGKEFKDFGANKDMAKNKYGKAGMEGKTGNLSGYQEPKIVENLYDFFQKMEAENQITQREPKPESIMEVNKKRLRKVFRINMGREPHF